VKKIDSSHRTSTVLTGQCENSRSEEVIDA
jgi:hypothetical protein